MIKKLGMAEHEQVMQFLSGDAAFNLFTIGDIEAFGYDSDFQELWGDYAENGELRGVLLRLFHNYIPYGVEDFDAAAFTEIINRDLELEMVSGKAEIAEKFSKLPPLAGGTQDTLFFAQLQPADLNQYPEHMQQLSRVKKATLEDLDRILALRAQIPTFSQSPSNRDSLLKSMEKGISRTFYMEDEQERMISAASTAAENSLSAMVVGVCSLPEFRKQGLASLCMMALCKELLAEGRSLCLFYNNPEAGAIYKRLGFRDIGHWCMYKTVKGE